VQAVYTNAVAVAFHSI